jgi:hypothetical protein
VLLLDDVKNENENEKIEVAYLSAQKSKMFVFCSVLPKATDNRPDPGAWPVIFMKNDIRIREGQD